MPRIIVTIDVSDPDDVDWLRNRAVPAVEDVVDEAKDEGRLDGTAEVSWDVDFGG